MKRPSVVAAELVLHAAAWTDVDAAEDDPQEAAAVNVGGVQHAAALGAPLVVWSTDYVFDGTKREPYLESDAPSPLGAYGRTKLYGEGAAGEHAWIVRSSWLFGPTSKNFLRTMLRLGAERAEVAVVDDQRGSPTYVGHLAEATKEVLELPFGVYHAAAAGDCTWADFAEAIFEEAGLRRGFGGSRRPSSVRGRRGPGIRCCAARGALPCSHTGARGCARALTAWVTRPGGTLPPMRVLVTGGAGFIGSQFVRHLAEAGDEVAVLDKLTYAGNRGNLEGVEHDFHHGDIADPDAVARAAAGCDAIVNFAAETHVDRSILGPAEFILTDVLGTQVLLDYAREHGIRHLQVSTDEVYGDIPLGADPCTESAPVRASSPYSASKAGGDLQVLAYVRTYDVDALITRGANTYGPRQYPEKFLPLFITNALSASTCRCTAMGASVASGCTSRITVPASSVHCVAARQVRCTTSAARNARTSTSFVASST